MPVFPMIPKFSWSCRSLLVVLACAFGGTGVPPVVGASTPEATAMSPTSAPVMFRGDPAHHGLAAGPSIEFAGMAWRFATGGPVRSTPAIANGLAVFGSNDGFLYAVELTSGREKWKIRLGGEVSSSPAIAGDRVVVLGGDGVLHALRIDDGSALWTLATGADVPFGSDPRNFDLWVSSPTIADGVIYVGGGDGRVHAVDLATGQARWSQATQHRVRSTPAVVDGAVYVGSFDGHVYALDAETGEERWKFNTGDAVQSSPAVANGTVVFGSRSMAVFALDAKTGALKWRRPHSGSWILASAAIADGKVIIGGSDSHLLEALDLATGEPVWSRYVGARMLGSPTVVGEVVAYGGEDFRVYTVDVATGLGLSIEFTEAALYGSVAIGDGMLLVGCEDGHVYAFRTRPARPLEHSAPDDVLRSAVGCYRTESGDVYRLSISLGRVLVNYCTYPPAMLAMRADGSFEFPMLWGTTGRLIREDGQRVSALVLQQFGQEITAHKINR